MILNYILDADGYPVPEPDTRKFAQWFEVADNRQLARTDLPGDVLVSTVFLGIDHGWGDTLPVLWETMIFGGEHNGYQTRYSSRTEALDGHDRAVSIARGEVEA